MKSALTIECVGASELRNFVELPAHLYRSLTNYVPQLSVERLHALRPRSREYLRRAETIYWLARRDGRAVGRISAQLDPLALQCEPGVGHFGLIAAEDDYLAVESLLSAAGEWLRDRGARIVRGPFNLSINEEIGVLIQGLNTPPMIMMPHDPPYLGRHIEAAGFSKARDVFAYNLDCARALDSRMEQLLAMRPTRDLVIRQLRKNDFDCDLRRVASIFNEAWLDNWGFVPFTPKEFDEFAQSLRLLVDERLVWFADLNEEAVGFLVCLPNLNEAIWDLDGRIFPAGWLKLLWRLKWRGVRSARIPLMGIKKSVSKNWVGRMIPFLLIGALGREVRKRGVERIELSWVLEDNQAMRQVAEAFCGEPYKTYRIYEKVL